MAEKISLELVLEADKADLTLGQLREGFKSLEEELENTKRGTKRFDELSTAMAQTNREIKNMELGFEALDNEQVASELGSVAGAIGDVTASFILMSGESETMAQIGANIEKAMAVSMGLKGAIEGISSAQKLWTNLLKTHTVVQKALTLATKLFKFALAATGIGLIVIGVAALIGNLEGLKNTFKAIGLTIYEWVKPPIDLIIEGLKFLGIMESDTEKATREAGESMVKSYQDRQEALKKQLEAHKETTNSIVRDIDFDIAKRQAAGKNTEKLERKKLKVLWKSAKIEKELQRQRLIDIGNEIKARIQNGKITEEELEKWEAQIKEQKAALTKSREDFKKIHNDFEVFEIKLETVKRERYNKRKGRLTEDAELEQIRHDVKLANAQEEIDMTIHMVATQETLLADLERIRQEQADRETKRIEDEFALREKRLDSVQVGLDILNNGADAFVKDEEKREKIKKKLAVAQIAIDTARAISSGIAAAAGIPFPGNLIAFLPTIATILGNMAQAKKLLGSSGGGAASTPSALSSAGASSGGAAAGVPINPNSNTSTILGDTKVFVTETDISATQNQVGVIEASATF